MKNKATKKDKKGNNEKNETRVNKHKTKIEK